MVKPRMYVGDDADLNPIYRDIICSTAEELAVNGSQWQAELDEGKRVEREKREKRRLEREAADSSRKQQAPTSQGAKDSLGNVEPAAGEEMRKDPGTTTGKAEGRQLEAVVRQQESAATLVDEATEEGRRERPETVSGTEQEESGAKRRADFEQEGEGAGAAQE